MDLVCYIILELLLGRKVEHANMMMILLPKTRVKIRVKGWGAVFESDKGLFKTNRTQEITLKAWARNVQYHVYASEKLNSGAPECI